MKKKKKLTRYPCSRLLRLRVHGHQQVHGRHHVHVGGLVAGLLGVHGVRVQGGLGGAQHEAGRHRGHGHDAAHAAGQRRQGVLRHGDGRPELQLPRRLGLPLQRRPARLRVHRGGHRRRRPRRPHQLRRRERGRPRYLLRRPAVERRHRHQHLRRRRAQGFLRRLQWRRHAEAGFRC